MQKNSLFFYSFLLRVNLRAEEFHLDMNRMGTTHRAHFVSLAPGSSQGGEITAPPIRGAEESSWSWGKLETAWSVPR